jgi:hypothetical protein
MSVVNVKVCNIRPEYANLKEWMNDPENVYIGRAGIVFIDGCRFPKKNSIWSNPFKINDKSSRKQVLRKYEIYLRNLLDNDENLVNELKKLRGKNLGCWCYPEMCHGNILLKLIEEFC